MRSGWFPRLGVLAVGLVIAAFTVTGLGRFVVGSGTARAASIPLFLAGLGVAVVGFVLALLVKTGLVMVHE